VHFDGNKIGVMWSDQASFGYWFSVHVDGDADSVWSTPEEVLAGVGDDHINLKVAADGRLFTVLKTSTDQVRLAVRETNGDWSDHLVSSAEDGWTRSICALDEDADVVHVFATSPILAGTIYEKTSPMDAISFPNGIGTPVVFSAEDPSHNDATTTKQALGGATGLVVLAAHQPTEHYWFHLDDLGGPVPAAPVAAPSADPRSGFAPLEVQFFDGSGNAPTAWSWSFGDGEVSSEQHPVHVYASPGTYAVSLTVTNGLGEDSRQVVDWIQVDPAPAALTLPALEDAYLRAPTPDDSYGDLDFLRVRAGEYRTIVRFLVPSSAHQVVSAELRLFCTDASPDGGTVHALGSSWQEPFVTWNQIPSPGGTPLGSLGSVSAGAWAALDVGSAVTSSGLVAFELVSSSSNSAFYSSREGSVPPQLVLTLQPPPPAPVAAFTSSASQGPVPLAVEFSDASSHLPTAWFWDFGDGATSTLQNPVHVYTVPGTYTVSLTATNASGSDVETLPGYVRARAVKTKQRPGPVRGPLEAGPF
jgi:PKD repeat protein